VDKDSPDDAEDAELGRSIGNWLTRQVFDLELDSVVIDDRSAEPPSEPRTFRDLRPPHHPPPAWMMRIYPETEEGRPGEPELAPVNPD
jgi:hypothetical protein